MSYVDEKKYNSDWFYEYKPKKEEDEGDCFVDHISSDEISHLEARALRTKLHHLLDRNTAPTFRVSNRASSARATTIP